MSVYVIVSEREQAPQQRRVLTSRASKRGAERVAASLAQSSTQRGRRVYAEERDAYWLRTHNKRWSEHALQEWDLINSVARTERF